MASIDLSHRIIQDRPPTPKPSSIRWHPWRRALQVALGVLLVVLPFTNGLRLDVRAGVFYFAWRRMAAHDVMLLFWVGVTALWILIAVSFLYGRFWCGWVCPQTLASDFADSLKRRIDKAFRARPGRPSFLPARALWASLMIGMSALVGTLLLCYWFDPRAVGQAVLHPLADPGIAAPVYAVSAVIAGDLLWLRRKFCSGACPYGLLLGSIADKNTLAVRYLDERSDDCIKCGQCVTVCPMGIDIKKGVGQMECIGCGECVDACNDVLGRRKIPGLIEYRFGVEPELTMQSLRPAQRAGLWDAKRGAILATTVGCIAAVLVTAFHRSPSAATLWATGHVARYASEIDNSYNLNLTNGLPEPQSYRLSILGVPGAAVSDSPGVSGAAVDNSTGVLRLEGHDSTMRTITVTAPPSALPPDSRVQATLVLSTAHERIETPIVFYAPPQ